MSPQTQIRIFDPFFTSKFSGRGLGLAVAQGIVRSLDGAIDVTSELGAGTTFQVLLPCGGTANGAGVPANAVNGKSATPSGNRTLLVVEDEDHLRQAVARMLRKRGYTILEVGDGSSAIGLLRADSRRVDLILLDMTIPGASTHDVVQEAASSRPDIRVIVTSTYSHEVIASVMSLPGPQLPSQAIPIRRSF
jgi:CheY-like chemotaxis protein